MSYTRGQKGFTLVEVLVGTAIFVIVAAAAYGAFVSLLRLANASQADILGVELADEQFEIIRNMPYINVGLTNGTPLGVLPQTQTLTRGGFTFTVTLVIRNQNLSTTTLQASTKLVEVDITCPSCQSNFTPIALTGQVSPANLQSAGAGGALIINVINSSGNPIQGATVVMQSDATSSIQDTDVTNNNGVLDVIGLAPGYQVYHVSVSKSGYTSASTSPDLTVTQGNSTPVTLTIDQLSNLVINSVTPTCQAAPSFHFNLANTGTYSQNLVTNSSGSLALNSIAPGTYALTPNDSVYDANGITPFSPFVLNPGATQNVQLVVVPASENSLLVTVKNGSGLPVAGATVELSGGGYDQTLITGQGFVEQNWANDTSYTSAAGIIASSGSAVLLPIGNTSTYVTGASSSLISETFGTGTTSNFYALNWNPISQPPSAGTSSVGFWVATAASSTGPWYYYGPDGTSGSYYSVPGTAISSSDNSNEFLRYYMFMSTASSTITPSIGEVSVVYTSGCLPPGQVLFQGVPAGSNYLLKVSQSTTTATTTLNIASDSGWQSQTIQLSTGS